MLKTLSPERVDACLAEAAGSPMAADGVEYPTWYLHRWHFLPEGYLSRRSSAMYDAVVRRVYNVASEARLHAALVAALMRQGAEDILELGSGPGNGLLAMHTALPSTKVTGIDLSPFLLEMAHDRLPERAAELVHGDATRLPWSDGAFDAVVSQHVLGHLPPAAALTAWNEASRVLRPGGRLYLLEHAWHKRRPGPLRPALKQPLLAGLIRLEAFEKAEA
ncbi:MAG: class I SAM-dependent methyltransferase [Dehalococcoidia bacterium]